MIQRRIIDLLPDRSSATFAQWLEKHPEVEGISRDRGAEFASGAKQGAPQARQIADRFHLVSNLAEVLQPRLSRCRSEICAAKQQTLPQAEQDGSSSQAPAQEPTLTLPHPDTWKQQAPQQMHRAYQARQKEREDRFAQIIELREQGIKQTEIAKRVGMGDACHPHLA